MTSASKECTPEYATQIGASVPMRSLGSLPLLRDKLAGTKVRFLWPSLPPGNIDRGNCVGLGEVISHGEGVSTPAVGTKVGIKYAAGACLSCVACLQGGETSCRSKAHKLSGYMYPGTFQQYVVSPANYVTPFPSDFPDLASAAPLMCGGVSVYAALKRAQVKQGDWVAISGAGGGLGHLAVQSVLLL